MLIDVSMPIHDGMPQWPGDPSPRLEVTARVERDGMMLSRLGFGSHTGTHIDAPAHFLAGGATVDALPLDALVGPCRVLDLRGVAGPLPASALPDVKRGERLLLRTDNGVPNFCEDFIALSVDAARLLAESGVVLIGIDALSIEPFGSQDYEVHKTLLRAGIVIVEGIDLSQVTPGDYHVMALPLRLRGLDGAPARVLLERDKTRG